MLLKFACFVVVLAIVTFNDADAASACSCPKFAPVGNSLTLISGGNSKGENLSDACLVSASADFNDRDTFRSNNQPNANTCNPTVCCPTGGPCTAYNTWGPYPPVFAKSADIPSDCDSNKWVRVIFISYYLYAIYITIQFLTYS